MDLTRLKNEYGKLGSKKNDSNKINIKDELISKQAHSVHQHNHSMSHTHDHGNNFNQSTSPPKKFTQQNYNSNTNQTTGGITQTGIVSTSA